MAAKKDRRVQRTQQLLRDALFALIREKGFEKLSVQEIIDRANVGRATFYAHFDNKDDLLLSGFDALKASLKERQRHAHSRNAELDERAFAFSYDLLAHIDEFRHLFRAMAGKRSGVAAQSAMRKLINDLVREDMKAMHGMANRHGSAHDAAVEFIAGGLAGLMMWWLSGKAKLPIEELNALFRSFAIPVAKAALK